MSERRAREGTDASPRGGRAAPGRNVAAGEGESRSREGRFQVAPFAHWVVHNPLPSLSILGVLLYGILRLAYLFFYLRLRTTPEEVGYGYSRVLSESVVGALELVALVFAMFSIGGLVVHAAMASARRGRARVRRPERLGAVQWVFIRAVMAALVIVLAGLPIVAWWQGGLAENGQTVRNVYFTGVPYLPILAVQAVPVRVAWLARPAAADPLQLSRRECLMYLGRADGIAVFYDVQTHESIRVPASDIVISFVYSFFVAAQCRTGTGR